VSIPHSSGCHRLLLNLHIALEDSKSKTAHCRIEQLMLAQSREVQTGREPLTLKSPSGIPLRFWRGTSGPPGKNAGASAPAFRGGRLLFNYQLRVPPGIPVRMYKPATAMKNARGRGGGRGRGRGAPSLPEQPMNPIESHCE